MIKSKRIWTIIRVMTFVVIGILNTVMLKPEDVGGWKNYVGFGFLILAVIEVSLMIKNLKKAEE